MDDTPPRLPPDARDRLLARAGLLEQIRDQGVGRATAVHVAAAEEAGEEDGKAKA